MDSNTTKSERFQVDYLERGRFEVIDSRGSGKPHLVDVCAYDGAGACDCGAYIYRGIRPCKHMREVYMRVGMRVANQIYSKYKDGNENQQI